ncbi:MAG: HEPN domain-containing protein [candidate division WOR-3 bacterium]|nr:HEPN domain-containing protein [candidate division WOR-3 bacterium]
MSPETVELIRYRLLQAADTIREAELLAGQGMLRGAVNRFYYGMFYATLALLATRDLGSPKHSGVIALFHREFVRTGLFPAELARSLDRAFDLRNKGDYRDFVEIRQEQVDDLLPAATAFVDKVNDIVSGLLDVGF